jgi:hypothetical protein
MSDTPPTIGQDPWGQDLNAYLNWLETTVSTQDAAILANSKAYTNSTSSVTLATAYAYTDAQIAAISIGGGEPPPPVTLSPNNALDPLLSDSPVLTTTPPVGTLGPINSIMTMTSDTPTLTAALSLIADLFPANATHVMTSSNPRLLPEGAVELTMEVGATTFQPWVQLQSGSTATITWKNSSEVAIGTGSKPTITVPTDRVIRMYVTQGGLPAMDQVDYFNIGFDMNQDAGRDNIGATYNWPGQRVVDMAGTQLLTGMRYFMAANTPLNTAFNFTGMSNLLHIECFGAQITTAVMTGCTSLIRICVEGCKINYFDFSPVKNNLRDLRCATNTGGPVTFFCDGPMTQLYHYCVRDQEVAAHLPCSQLPVIFEYWVYGTGITDMDPIISPLIESVQMQNNPLTAATVENNLISINSLVGAFPPGNGGFDFGNGPPPTAVGQAARESLEAKGWPVIVPQFGTANGGDGTNGTFAAPTAQPWVNANLIPSQGIFGTGSSISKTVTGGVLSVVGAGYTMVHLKPTASNTWQNCYFEVTVNAAEVADGISYWMLYVNADIKGFGGLRCTMNWNEVNLGYPWGVGWGPPESPWVGMPGYSPPGSPSERIAPNPVGWGNPGLHKVGLYHAGDTAYVVLDGVKVYRARNNWIDWRGAGPYCGVGGDFDGSTTRTWQSWGYTPVTLT